MRNFFFLQELAELKNTQGINIWSQTQELLEEQALREIEAFTSNANVEEGEITENENIDSDKPRKEIVINNTLDINEFIKRQEELKKRQDHVKSLQVSEKSKLAAEQASKQVKRRREGKKINIKHSPKKAKLEEVKSKKNNDDDSDYEPTDEVDSVPITPRKKRNSESTRIEKVKDDGSVSCYKARLEQYYKRLEEEKMVLNKNNNEEEIDEEEEFHTIKGGLKVPLGVWNNLYR